MGKINDLIAEGELTAAADVLYDNFYTIITSRVALSRAEFAKVAPEFVKKLQNPISEKEKTDAPGDDIEIVDPKNTAALKISFEGPEGMNVPKDFEKKIMIGRDYSYAAPEFEGFTVKPESVSGTMSEDGAEAAFVYTANESDEEPVDEKKEEEKQEEQKEEAPKTATLTIVYDGPEGFNAPDPVEQEVEIGKQYNVASPAVEGYTPDKANVSGTMGKKGAEITVTYTKNVVKGDGEPDDSI